MSIEDKPTDDTPSDEPLAAIDIGAERPLAQCVQEAVQAYFETLGDHDTSGLYQMVLREVERPLLVCVLERTGGNQSTAAQMLGMSRGTLRKKLREYDL